eukprot:scaffold24926_cov67-Phaeocystis_antarctica.AAC.8
MGGRWEGATMRRARHCVQAHPNLSLTLTAGHCGRPTVRRRVHRAGGPEATPHRGGRPGLLRARATGRAAGRGSRRRARRRGAT